MLTAIIVDDEKNSREALQKKLQLHCAEISVSALCSNGTEGLEAIARYDPQLVFLDIEMPTMNGFTMLEQVKERRFEVIFTTAYNQYAINAIRYGAFDYLVKPIDIAALTATVNRVKSERKLVSDERLQVLMGHLQNDTPEKLRKIAIATHEGLEVVVLDQVMHLEAVGNYTLLHFADQSTLLSSKTLKDFDDLLQGAGFFRIHNASLVNLAYVKKYLRGDGGQVELTNKVVLDVARRRKDELLQMITRMAARL